MPTQEGSLSQRPLIPLTYHDLKRTDIEALTGVLCSDFSTSSTKGITSPKILITKLPSHLRSKLPWLTTLCSQHKMMNPLPLTSLRDAFLALAQHELHDFWQPMLSQDALTTEQSDTVKLLKSFIQRSPNAACAGCELSESARDIGVLMVFGSITIAKLRPGDWKRSKRIMFVESCLRKCRKDDASDYVLRRMWALGFDCHQLRQRHRPLNNDRPYIDNYIARIQPRSLGSQPQDNPLALEKQVAGSDTLPLRINGDTTVAGNDAYSTAESGPNINRKPLPMLDKSNVSDNAFQNPDVGDLFPYTDAASRYSSVPTMDQQPHKRLSTSSSWSEPPEDDSGQSLLDLYRDFAFPLGEVAAAKEVVEETAAPQSMIQSRQRDPELAKYPRHKLAPITIPNSNYGNAGNNKFPRTHSLWCRRVEGKLPQLRIGKSGEVKGPLDSMSDIGTLFEAEPSRRNWI